MVTIEKIKDGLDAVPCPVCHHVEWDILYRCDLDYSGCLYDAKCRNCDYDMEVSEGDQFIESRYGDDIVKIRDNGCSSCHGRDMDIHYRCELKDKKCLYISVCNSCHTVNRMENV